MMDFSTTIELCQEDTSKLNPYIVSKGLEG